MRCKETSGVLFAHPCSQDSTMSCTVCNKPICERHMRYKADKPACITCVRADLQQAREQGRRVAGGYERDPFFFHYYGPMGRPGSSYADDDFELFDGSDAGAAYAMDDDGAWAGS